MLPSLKSFLTAVLAAGALALLVGTADARPRVVVRTGPRIAAGRAWARGGVRAWGWRRGVYRGPYYGYRGYYPAYRRYSPYYRGYYPYYGSRGYYPYVGYLRGYVPYVGYVGYGPVYSYGYVTTGPVLSGTITSGAINPSPAAEETPAAPADKTARVLVVVPEGATMWVDGVKVEKTGTEREIVSPELTPDKMLTWSIRVRSATSDGKVTDETRRVDVSAGDRWLVDFTRPAPRTN
jgi:uncharacterized protein (TIGR03000 family)